MHVYIWNDVFNNYGPGQIIAVAESLDSARAEALATIKHDAPWWDSLNSEDSDRDFKSQYQEAYEKVRDTEPGVYDLPFATIIHGSD